MAKMTLAQGQVKWQARHDKLMALQPTSFRGAMRGVFRVDKQWLDKQVYMAQGKGKRSGALRRSERLEYASKFVANIVNDARSAGVAAYMSMGKKGGGDITAVLKPHGRHAEFEAKTGAGRQSEIGGA